MKLKNIIALGLSFTLLFSQGYIINAQEENKPNNTVSNENDVSATKTRDVLMVGNDLTQTSISISRVTYKNSDSVIISGKNATIDLLSSAPLSGLLKSPILINSGEQIHPDIEMEIKRLGAKNVFVISGEKYIPKSLINKATKDGYKIINLSGKDRYQTSDNIAEYIITNKKDFEKSILINGVNYADAPSISAFAYSHITPILLTNGKDLTKETFKIVSINKNILMVGGDKSISDKLYENLQDQLMKIGRIKGKDRYETSKKIVEGLFEFNNNLLIADGVSDLDIGIISAGYCTLEKRPLLLVNKNYEFKDQIVGHDKIYVSEKAKSDLN